MAELGFFVVPNSDGNTFILINDIYVEHYPIPSRVGTRSTSKRSQKDISQYLKGTLLREAETNGDFSIDRNKVMCKHPESEVYFQCSRKDLREISENIYELLLAISSCRERLEVCNNDIRLAEGLEMDVGNDVFVKIPNQGGELRGIIKYKGAVSGKDGIQFGVELDSPEGMGKGNSNGGYAKERYFQCDTDCGIFLPLSRVRPLRNRNQSPVSAPRKSKQSRLSGTASSSRSRSTPETCPLTHNISEEELQSLGIRHGMEVYIFTEVKGRESQEKGKVKFIGRLPGASSSQGIYVGIDLDRGVGNGTGLYNGKHLFYTKQNHAALVPLSGVLPAYVTDLQASPESNNRRQDLPSSFPSETKAKKSHRVYNSSPGHSYRASGNSPHSQKTFVQQSTRTAYSSPSVLGGRTERVEEYPVQETDISSQRRGTRRSPRPRESPMETSPPENTKPEFVETLDRSQRVSARRPLHTPDSDDNSGDDTDLYGSDNSIALAKLTERKDLRSPSDARSASVPDHYRPREVASMPGGPAVVPVVINQNRSKTVPGYGRRNGRLAEVVDFSAIQKLTNGTPEKLTEMSEMEVGTMVEVTGEAFGHNTEPGPMYGVVKWIGTLPDHEEPAAGVELERSIANGTDGTFNGVKYFSCDFGRGHFIFLKFCRKDPRFSSPEPGAMANLPHVASNRDFGNFDSPEIPGEVPPPRKLITDMVGKKRGIQGHHNSCYLDSTLFSLFAYSQALDTILFRQRKTNDLPEYEETQKVLKELIINPLRKHHFVRADRIMQLRTLLDRLGSTTGLVNEEKDPEEFLNTLLNQVFKAEPLHELRQGDSNAAHEGYFYQIFMERDEKFQCPNTQQLLEKSLVSADLKFRNIPVCLILQMPRFGKDYKMYKKVRPSLQLDITDLVEDMPRSCDVCEAYAEFECRDCFMEGSMNEPNMSFCGSCAERVHQHRKRKSHRFRAIKLPDEFREYADDRIANKKQPFVQRQTLELFAVVCIATSHYVSFAKCGTGVTAKWVFFDSMADRVGEQNGYNIPEITLVKDFEKWLEEDEGDILREDEKLMPELKRRLLCDSYMCMYQSRELMSNK